MVLKRLLGIDRVLEILDSYKFSLKTIERQTRLIYQHQHKLEKQHIKLSEEHRSIIDDTEFMKSQLTGLNALKEILTMIEEKVEHSSEIEGEIRVAHKLIDTMISETDKKYLDAIKNLKKVSANDLAIYLGVKRGTTSAKLSELYQRNLVDKVRIGKKVYYVLKEEKNEEGADDNNNAEKQAISENNPRKSGQKRDE